MCPWCMYSLIPCFFFSISLSGSHLFSSLGPLLQPWTGGCLFSVSVFCAAPPAALHNWKLLVLETASDGIHVPKYLPLQMSRCPFKGTQENKFVLEGDE